MKPCRNHSKILDLSATKRGDTIIEVMFAIALFCLVAVIAISMMNSGVSSAEGTLELVATRNELNAQAEALRFVHSSYISEKSLPELSATAGDTTRQQYRELWQAITSHAIDPPDDTSSDDANLLLDLDGFIHDPDSDVQGCERIYDDSAGKNVLENYNAFVLNTRNLNTVLTASGAADISQSYIPAGTKNSDNSLIFRPAVLNARLVFTSGATGSSESTEEMLETAIYDRIKYSEGIWVIAVKSNRTAPINFYDFYIQSCWYGPGSETPNVLDTVIRLFNPKD